MISANAVTEWAVEHPWPSDAQVEQDLLLSQAICLIGRHEFLGRELVFRGGTALHKLALGQPLRFSEDLDYVRMTAGGIAPITEALTNLGEGLGYSVATRVG